MPMDFSCCSDDRQNCIRFFPSTTFFPFTILSGGTYELKSFVIGVLGGLGNPLGALVGGLILGMLEGMIPYFTSTAWVPVIEFVLFVIILLVRPQGIFGAKK